ALSICRAIGIGAPWIGEWLRRKRVATAPPALRVGAHRDDGLDKGYGEDQEARGCSPSALRTQESDLHRHDRRRENRDAASSSTDSDEETATQLVLRLRRPSLWTNGVLQSQISHRPHHPLVIAIRPAPLEAHPEATEFPRAQWRIYAFGPIPREFQRP